METKTKDKTNSYLTFKIGEEVFAANVSKVISILELVKITKLPRTPDYIRGVINLRGTVLPIVDLRLKFGLSATEFTSNTCILVLDLQMDEVDVKIGALVDSVQEVLEIEDNELLPAPKIGKNNQNEIIEAMYKADDDTFIMVLNLNLIFSSDELTVMTYSELMGAKELNMEEGSKDSETKDNN
jgi:purine-binding chemotaxis protein CheW